MNQAVQAAGKIVPSWRKLYVPQQRAPGNQSDFAFAPPVLHEPGSLISKVRVTMLGLQTQQQHLAKSHSVDNPWAPLS